MKVPLFLRRWCARVLPDFRHRLRERNIRADVRRIHETDRWNSFDQFHKTAQYVALRYHQAALKVEVLPMPTGGVPGSGRWRIFEAWDVESATLAVVEPETSAGVIADYARNPFHLIQWSTATPREGLRGPVVIVDSLEEARQTPPAVLRGAFVLTRFQVRALRPILVEKGAVGLIYDGEVKGFTGEVAWQKFGWGAWPAASGALRCVGFCLSKHAGQELRRLVHQGRTLVEARVDTRFYVGHHDLISAQIAGTSRPDDEIWALAHLFEPGAVDNASGCAALLAAGALLQAQIASGRLEPPRRTLRLLHAYEAYGFFTFYEQQRRLQPPLAGVDIDSVGVSPAYCQGNLCWHAPAADSPAFVHRLGGGILQRCLRLGNPGYRLRILPFGMAGDDLLGDPRYGMPTPWLCTHPFRGYHSSGDRLEQLSSEGLEIAAAFAAAYLYFLAQAGNRELHALAEWETQSRLDGLRGLQPGRASSRGRNLAFIEREVTLHDRSLRGLERWIAGGDRGEVLKGLERFRRDLRQGADHAAARVLRRSRSRPRAWAGAIERLTPVPRGLREQAKSLPVRKAALPPMPENFASVQAEKEREIGLPRDTVFFADGRRNLRAIAGWLALARGGEADLARLVGYFQILEEIGDVTCVRPAEALTRRGLESAFRRLGVRRGMDLMVHSSLSSLGPIIGGAETVIDALLAVLGSRGTLMMPSFNHGLARVYDVRTTPTINGVIPDAFWRRPGVCRSIYPTHPIAALGPKARRWTAGHLETLCWGPQSPLGRLIHEGGYILLLGVNHHANTAYHVAETSMPAPCLGQFERPSLILDHAGRALPVRSMQFRAGRCPVSPDDLDRALDRRGLQRRGKVGAATCILVRGLDVFHAHRKLLAPHCPTCPIRPRKSEE